MKMLSSQRALPCLKSPTWATKSTWLSAIASSMRGNSRRSLSEYGTSPISAKLKVSAWAWLIKASQAATSQPFT